MIYPFSPEILDTLPEEIAELYRALEIHILEDIARQISTGKINAVTLQNIRTLRSHGISLTEIKAAIKKTAKLSERKLVALFDEAAAFNQKYYASTLDLAGLTAPEVLVDKQTIDAIIAQTQNELHNITRSLGFLVDAGRTFLPQAKVYTWALDNAIMEVQGGYSYSTAIAKTVKQLADSGIQTVSYESKYRSRVDVAVRRAVLTGLNQLNRQYDNAAMEELETDLVEVSAHSGARDKDGPNGWENHKAWQGRVYRWKKYTKKFPKASTGEYKDFEDTCGLGSVTGILGANCRHSYHVFIEGVMEPTYTEEQLAKIDPPDFTYDGKKYTHYEATQKQREIESTIRQLQREKAAYEAAGLKEDAQAVGIRIRRLKQEYKDFSFAAGLRTQTERMSIKYIDDTSKLKAAELKVQRDIEAPIRVDIRSGKYPLSVNLEKQARHMQETAPPGRSVITVSEKRLQDIINTKAGTGRLWLSAKTRAWTKREIVDADTEIGYTINKKGDIIHTKSLKLHYSKTGIHAVPYSRRWKK